MDVIITWLRRIQKRSGTHVFHDLPRSLDSEIGDPLRVERNRNENRGSRSCRATFTACSGLCGYYSVCVSGKNLCHHPLATAPSA